MKFGDRKELDKFYTKYEVAKFCIDSFKKIITKPHTFVEPSAGNGAFLKLLPENTVAFDLLPELSEIVKLDFLKDDAKPYLPENPIFIGNPPFGKKSKLAIDFVNKCLEYSDCVGFILPIQFRKWSVQNRINENAKLVLDLDLPHNIFIVGDKELSIRCCFQVWSLEGRINLRLLKPTLEHKDFVMYQYNRTNPTERFFDYDWDFAVIRQGFHDYSKKAFSKEDCDKKQQWIFFKANNNGVLGRLLNLDFDKLSKLNTTIPGFGKADVVKEYNNLYKTTSKIESLFE